MKYIIYSILISVIFFSCSVSRNNDYFTKAGSDSLANDLQNSYSENHFAGFSVAVVNENGTLYENGLGYADLADQKKYTSNTIQNVGSISKTLVGIAMMKAQELGKLKLDDPINKYLPFVVQNPFHPELPITLLQLVTHTSTITDNKYYSSNNYILLPGQEVSNDQLVLEDDLVFNPTDSAVSLENFLRNCLSIDGKWKSDTDFLNNKPGEKFEYTNVGTALAAYIIEAATGEKFTTFTKKHILIPLQMSASGWKFTDVNFSNYSRLFKSPGLSLPYYSLITYPDGNFITSAHDLAKFLTELIKGFQGNGILLSRESYQQYFEPRLSSANFRERNVKNPYNDEYNVGVFIGFSFSGNVGHTGSDPGVNTMMFFDPLTKTGRLLITNTDINNKEGAKEFYNIFNKLGDTRNVLSGKQKH